LIRRQYEKERKKSLCSKWQGLGAEGDKDNLKINSRSTLLYYRNQPNL
jgi:hypothetical protein